MSMGLTVKETCGLMYLTRITYYIYSYITLQIHIRIGIAYMYVDKGVFGYLAARIIK